ncbi:MAG: hypothetical protein H0U27_10960 [Nitrosopumilus sp.]|nr:hypothetical protein [Nitrosopumilus sp.]
MSQFNESLEQLKNNVQMSQSQKISSFYDLCKEFDKEPIILRLSGNIKNRFTRSNYLITFTDRGVFISKKRNLQNLFDIGYVAGLGPYLYYLLSDKVKFDDIKLKDSVLHNGFSSLNLTNELSYLNYKEISKLIFYHGVETTVTNMLGSAVNDNFLRIYTQKDSYNFGIPAKKNGDYKKIFYWLRMCLPITISQK